MLQVVCAVIQQGDQYLLCQRSSAMKLPLKWEFPGGKVEPGESLQAALQREIKEELNLQIQPLRALTAVEFHYPEFSLRLHPFLCRIQSGTLHLNEHQAYVWVTKPEFSHYDIAQADLPVLLEL